MTFMRGSEGKNTKQWGDAAAGRWRVTEGKAGSVSSPTDYWDVQLKGAKGWKVSKVPESTCIEGNYTKDHTHTYIYTHTNIHLHQAHNIYVPKGLRSSVVNINENR